MLTIDKKTNELEEGAIVYVDDFAGTGRQFCTTRDNVKENIVGSFVEFLLVPVICEEALYELGKRDIEAMLAIFTHEPNDHSTRTAQF